MIAAEVFDLVFANPDGTLLKPNSVSASVSLLCGRLGLPKGASLHTLRHTHVSFCWRMEWTWRRDRNGWGTTRSA